MSTKIKKKVCWNCDGNIIIDKEICPYCGVHVNITPIPGTAPEKNLNLSSPFQGASSNVSEKTLPKAPYPSPYPAPLIEEKENEEIPKTVDEQSASDSLQQNLLTFISLLMGCFLMVFGFILFFFSGSKGLFTLTWNGNYWFVYLLLSLPLLYVGWRTLSKTE
jgi:hypothetical protein